MALADIQALSRNEDGIQTAIGVLKQRFGDALQTGEAIREQHAHTTTYIRAQLPDGVLFAASTDEVADAVQICAQYKVPIIPFGTGTSLEGHVNAPAGGISIDTSRMDAVLEVNPEDLDCVVQPGVTREQLNEHIRNMGLFFPVDPGANASLGGMTATRASGTNAVRYGTMKDNVISVEAVMADGTVINTASRARKSSAGYDLTRLMVGSEGTLGIITKITLRLHGIPEKIGAGICGFETVDGAVDATIAAIQIGLPVARIELVDELNMRAINDYSNLDYPVRPTLFLEFHGTETGVAEQLENFASIASDFGGEGFQAAIHTEDRNRLWQARHDAYWAALRLRPGAQGISTDSCVPISRLAECIAETRADIESEGVLAPIIGHVGDGNFHVLLLLDTQNAEEVAKAERIVERLNERTIAMGGTCTGEHGIGQGKRRFLTMELGESVAVMAAIKKALDPDNIMNPGKILPVSAA
ncbi:MAG: FAD-linked oxidase C-terminal domain-containing protein [Pseudomonadota bacterium]